MDESVRLGIICNLKHGNHPADADDEEAEFDSEGTVEAIRRALQGRGLNTVILEAGRDLPEKIRESGITMAFNIAEGRTGRSREAQVPALLDLLGIPYTGSDATALGVSLDKRMCKRLVSACGVRTAESMLITGETSLPEIMNDLHFPVIVKPNTEGSGRGIGEDCVAVCPDELEKILDRALPSCRDGLLAEKYLPGREFTVGILGNGSRKIILPPMEIIYNGNTQRDFKVYSYDVKCHYEEHVRYECPAKLSDREMKQISEAAGRVFDILGCADVARADFRMDAEGEFCFLEINPLPGLAPGYSDLPMAAAAAGIGYEELIFRIYKAASERLKERA